MSPSEDQGQRKQNSPKGEIDKKIKNEDRDYMFMKEND